MRARQHASPGSRLALGAIALLVLVAGCSVRPVEDPGLGDAHLTTLVLARDGSVIAEWHAGVDRTPVGYDELPPHLVDAVVAIEDRRFWEHPGVDLGALVRALGANVEAGDVVQGGSTITQQYIKNVLLSPDVELRRKAEELVLAVALEDTLTKEEILERYLNTIFFGSGAYGVGAAARRYFGVAVSDLTLPEAAMLAGVIRAPSTTNPIENPDAALARRNVVLDAMLSEGMITTGEHDTAVSAPLRLDVTTSQNLHPYFADEVQRLLLADERLGATVEERRSLLFEGGLVVSTTLDPDHQRAAETAIEAVMRGRAPEAALVAIEPATGDVLALVGGRDFYSGAPGSQFNLATRGRRQPGSTMKPFVLAAALEKGWSLTDPITGAARTTILTPDGPWVVSNHDDIAFPELTLADATAYSVNTAYATLIDAVDPASVVDVARRAGLGPVAPVPSLALGTEEVTLLELTSSYGTFAAGGTHATPRFVTAVTLADGDVLLANDIVVNPGVDPDVAEDVTAGLTGVVSRGTGALARIGRETAGKTGTTQDSADAWYIGYTPEVVAGVWVGFPTAARPLTYPATPFTITGGSWPATIWARYAIDALSHVPYADMPGLEGDDLVAVMIDPTDGSVLGPCGFSASLSLNIGIDPAPPIPCAAGDSLPQTVGMPAGEAIERLFSLGLPVTIQWREDVEVVPMGTIVGQEPQAGTPLVAPDALDGAAEPVVVMVAGSPQTMPALLGATVSEARSALRWMPVHLEVVVAPSDVGASGTVWKQSPIGGTPPEATVTIWVNP